jgi:hypothetical protein
LPPPRLRTAFYFAAAAGGCVSAAALPASRKETMAGPLSLRMERAQSIRRSTQVAPLPLNGLARLSRPGWRAYASSRAAWFCAVTRAAEDNKRGRTSCPIPCPHPPTRLPAYPSPPPCPSSHPPTPRQNLPVSRCAFHGVALQPAGPPVALSSTRCADLQIRLLLPPAERGAAAAHDQEDQVPLRRSLASRTAGCHHATSVPHTAYGDTVQARKSGQLRPAIRFWFRCAKAVATALASTSPAAQG